MKELLEELKYNKGINEQKGLPNVVDIDYIIERLQDINIYEEHFKNEIYWNIETMINDDYIEEDKREKLVKLNDNDIQPIIDKLMYNDYLNNVINEEITYNLNKLIEEK